MTGCRSCGSAVEVFLELGNTPLANSLPRPGDGDEPEPRFPLDLAFCQTCSLVQITETVPPEQLFGEYLYFSSFSTTMLEHARVLCDRLIGERGLGTDSLVVEIASNDGYLLRNYVGAGIPVLGVEPARNIARVAVERGIPTECEFFGREFGERMAREGRRADVIHGHNVMAHVADLNGFIAGIKAMLEPGGLVLIEAPYVKDLIDELQFDTIYHEHLCYFSATAVDALVRRHGLILQDVERIPIHGGSLRLFIGHEGAGEPSPRVRALLSEERDWGAGAPGFYRDFSRRVESLGRELKGLLEGLKAKGGRIAAYGASAKGSTLLNTFGIGKELLEFVADRSTHKQGRLMPGVHIPIVPTERLLESMPDHVLLLTWNFADEILEQQSEYRRKGGKFVVPIPEPRIV